MFTNLIESQSHVREFKRRSSFFLITVVAYAIALTGAGVASVFAYDAQLEAQSSTLELMSWVPPVTADAHPIRDVRQQVVRRSAPTTAPVDPNIRLQERTVAQASTNDPRSVPNTISTTGNNIPPVTGAYKISNRNADPPSVAPSNSGSCIACPTTPPVVQIVETPPTPPPVKPPTTQRVTSVVLNSKVVSLPQPLYPIIAKQVGVQGTVNIQILVDEQGRVVSAQIVTGNTLLNAAAREAAMRARFTPTTLNGVPVKIQGVITYNFRLQ